MPRTFDFSRHRLQWLYIETAHGCSDVVFKGQCMIQSVLWKISHCCAMSESLLYSYSELEQDYSLFKCSLIIC